MSIVLITASYLSSESPALVNVLARAKQLLKSDNPELYERLKDGAFLMSTVTYPWNRTLSSLSLLPGNPPSMNERVMPKEHCVVFTPDLCWLFVKLQTLFLRAPLARRSAASHSQGWEIRKTMRSRVFGIDSTRVGFVIQICVWGLWFCCAGS
jgi:hypothetical protein